MTPNERLKKVRKHCRLTQEKFGEEVGLKQYQVKDIEIGKQKVSPELAELIEIKFSISGWWLLTGNGEMLVKLDDQLPTLCKYSNDDNSSELITLNYYPDIVAAAGYGGINELSTQAYQVMKLDRVFLEDVLNIKHFNNIDVIRVIGDSMEPFIFDGEVVLIERNNEARNGETIIANINGHVYVKKFQTDPFGRWIKLVSNNGSYGEINLEGDQLEFFSIVGIVRAKIKAF